MTDLATASRHRWAISTRLDGEVLAATSADAGLDVLLLSGPEGYTAPEIEGWLAELIGVAIATARSTPADPALPALLHHALTGLLFSHAELWDSSPGHQPCSVACVATETQVGIGWAGDLAAEVEVDGCAWTTPLVRVRDDQGHEARAIAIAPDREVRVTLRWPATPGPEHRGGAEIVATWQPVRSEPPAWHFKSWVDQVEGAEVHSAGHAAAPEHVASPTSEHVASPASEHVAPPASEHVAPPASEHVAPPASEHVAPPAPEHVAAPASEPEPEPEPELIPPTPEPPELAQRAAPLASERAPEYETLPAPEPAPEYELVAGPAPPATASDVPSASVPHARGDDAFEWAEAPVAPRAPRARPTQWPAATEEPRAFPWRPVTVLAGIVVVLLAAGWWLGQSGGSRAGERPSLLARLGAALGLGPGHFALMVDSQPQGAWITVDGRESGQRTPATLDVEPGTHQVGLRLPSLGSAAYTVSGARDGHVPLDAKLWGALSVSSTDPAVPVTVSVDGVARGLAPVTVDEVAPGIHQVQFSAPGLGAWEQTAEVGIHQTAEIVAHPLAAPATGVLTVRATINDGGEAKPLTGARVWLDGEPRGVTPLKLELPRGPHSVRVSFHEVDSGVQVIDLPGGNQRFADFEIGGEAGLARLNATGLADRVVLEHPSVVSASVEGLVGRGADLREMWLHVSTPEGAWRRYPMSLLKSGGGAAGVAVFPVSSFDAHGRARWYVSAVTAVGDELFTEIQTAQSSAH